jgi:hypothetical protein
MICRQFVDVAQASRMLQCSSDRTVDLVCFGELPAIYLGVCHAWRIRITDIEAMRRGWLGCAS